MLTSMSIGTHRTDLCLCGAVQYDCDCPGPKESRVVQDWCDLCADRASRDKIVPDRVRLTVAAPGEVQVQDNCPDEVDNANNLAIRLAVFDILGDLAGKPLPNPQLVIAEVYQRVEVLPVWEQLVRDLVQEAIGEQRVQRQIQGNRSKTATAFLPESDIVPETKLDWEEQVVACIDEVLVDQVALASYPEAMPLYSRAAREVQSRLDGKADPLHVNQLIAARLARS
jgi:hypothetical protein